MSRRVVTGSWGPMNRVEFNFPPRSTIITAIVSDLIDFVSSICIEHSKTKLIHHPLWYNVDSFKVSKTSRAIHINVYLELLLSFVTCFTLISHFFSSLVTNLFANEIVWRGSKTSHESFSNFNFSIDRVGQRLVALPSNLSRPPVSRLSRSGPFTRKTWTSKRSAHGFLSNRHGSPSFVTEPIPEMPWLNRLDGDQWLQRGGRERERQSEKSQRGPPTRRSWFVRNARLSRENRDSRIIDTFQRVKKENSPSVGSITVWSTRNFESYCLGSLMRNRFLEKKK